MDKQNGISIVLSGEAGQGIQTIEAFMTRLFKSAGYHIFASKEYMSRIRGGSNSTEIRVASRPIAAFADRIDILIPFDRESLLHVRHRIDLETVVLGETSIVLPDGDISVTDIPFLKIAREIGNPVYANTVACGVIAGLFGINYELLIDQLRRFFSAKTEDIVLKNIEAVAAGYQKGKELHGSGRVNINLTPDESVENELLVNGAEAVALGAIAGGCNFISSYPMSPGTGVLTYLAQYSRNFPIIVEQAEDEISAVNMALGAWFAGARAIVTTSGGGFDLMTEGLSLAGMIESPLVIHLAQRPGPATGLPTRTEQSDLELALYAGHGEFPRIILTPGNISEAFDLTQRAFQLADRFQVPVFVLTDQFLVDSYSTVPQFNLKSIGFPDHVVETSADYRRYELTPDGISPRGIPGFGQGLVGVDSDEHDISGHITEDLDLRVQMNEKRLRKTALIQKEAITPELIGSPDCRILVVGWGSTYGAIKESLEILNRNDISFLHFKQVYPLPPDLGTYLKKASTIIVAENNATSQFGRLLSAMTGIPIHHQIRKYNGMPFSCEEIAQEVQALLEEVKKS